MDKRILIALFILGFTFTYFTPSRTLSQNTTTPMKGAAAAMTLSKKSDFDFLLGKWQVQNKRLKERLVGSNEWIEFPARLEGGRKFLNGLALMDQYKAEFNGEYFEGVSLRLFKPATEKWTIYWMDTSHPEMTEQVVGAFKDGIPKYPNLPFKA